MKKRKTGKNTAVEATSANTVTNEVPNFLEIDCLRDAYLAFVARKRHEKRQHRERRVNLQNTIAGDASQPVTITTPPTTVFSLLQSMNVGRTERPKSTSSASPSSTHTSTSSSPSLDLVSHVSPSTSMSGSSPSPIENLENEAKGPVKIFGKCLLTNTGYRNANWQEMNYSSNVTSVNTNLLPTQAETQFSVQTQPTVVNATHLPQITFLTPNQLQAQIQAQLNAQLNAQIQAQLQLMAQTQAHTQAQLQTYSPTHALTQTMLQTQIPHPAQQPNQSVTMASRAPHFSARPFAQPLGYRFFQLPITQAQAQVPPQAMPAILPQQYVLPHQGFFNTNNAAQNERQRQMLVQQMYGYGNKLNTTMNQNRF